MVFEFSTAQKIVFGKNALSRLPTLIEKPSQRALVVTGQSSGHFNRLASLLKAHEISCRQFSILGEPTVDHVARGLEFARAEMPDFVIGIGGGSALDAGKAIAALLPNEGDIFNYLEVIGKGMPLTKRPLPYFAIPTTAGTGSEVTSNAVLGSSKHGVKVSMRHASMLPRLALVDPALTLGVPPGLTASTGMDALTQCIEAFLSCRANPLVDGLCREGIRKSARSLRQAVRNGNDLGAREDMSLAALFSGAALANARLGAVHGIAGPMGGTTGAPHSVICAHLLPPIMKVNLKALQKREQENPSLPRFIEAAQLLTGEARATAEDGVEWLEQLLRDLPLPDTGSLGLNRNQIPELLTKCQRSSSMQGNPLILTDEEIEQVLEQLL